MNPTFSCIASLELTGEVTAVIAIRVWDAACRMPHNLEVLGPWQWKMRCWMTAWSHLSRQLIDFVWAPRDYQPAAEAALHALLAAAYGDSLGRLEVDFPLSWACLRRGLQSCVLPSQLHHWLCPLSSLVLNTVYFDQGHVFSKCCSYSVLWHIMKAEFKNKIQDTINFTLITC